MYYYQYYYPYRQPPPPQYPPIDTAIFGHSVSSLQKLALESSTLLKMFADPSFSHSLMTAAQAGNKMKVDSLIKSIGISTPVTVEYNPDGILLTMHAQAQAQGSQCCTLTMFLKWREFRG
ncbi:hypothetical protein NQ109_30775 [Priestia megaterium]|uniref:hypothetical protein n=1 Tax=Priestia megaterium TaxID=1404 RepID=UPI00215B2CA4|nr:hypothetical protein [Priestia megaterium]MCR8867297.1 hypothetical protein [Priestia megaterium]